jgi:predicted CXXCH cytochrome family protein
MVKINKTGFLMVVVVVVLLVNFFIPEISHSQVKTEAKKKDSCITNACHADINKFKFVHGPVAAGECTVCHGESKRHAENPRRYKFGAVKDLDKVCFKCHDKFKPKKFVHNPVQEGECTVCHSPHGSEFKFQLVAQGGELCFNCHDEELIGEKYVHGPAAVGGCVACHEPHTANYEKNLKAQGPSLCFTCHTDQAEAFQNAKVIHKPVAENCTKCHNPHSNKKQFMLPAEAPTLCFGCHKEKKTWVNNALVQHGALATGKSCLNCHEPHVSNIEKRLSMPPMDLCLSCHDKPVEAPDEKQLTNMKKLLEKKKDHHGPIRQKDCSGCHNPHGSNVFRILRYPYPAKFYMPFAVENYALCFSCHEKSIVLNPETTKLTNFRNGEINLHYKHVNKPEKGRTCRACHETHASNHPKHIRESVPFGSWELPINYEKNKTGGSCAPGCHKLKKYDRVKKVENP